MKNTKKIVKYLGAAIILLVLAIALLSIKISFLPAWRIVLGAVFVLFLPGFVLTYVFFPGKKEQEETDKDGSLDLLQRILLSFALSIAIVPLLLFLLNKMGLIINTLNSLIVIFVIIFISLIILVIQRKKAK